jgi:uncharacterized protein (TIGR02996 family)
LCFRRSPLEALEAHLRAHPSDSHGWLVYADWLLEQGDERGALIRLAALAQSEILRPIRHLHLYTIGDQGALALAATETLRELDWLSLRGNPLGADGRRALETSPLGPSLVG